MFLKPEVTRDYAQRIGHRFQFDYSPDPAADVYRSLLMLVADTKRALAELKPRDSTDVQSFIWTVGAYSESDILALERGRLTPAPPASPLPDDQAPRGSSSPPQS
ncbi:hypothetical protein [Sphingomonas sp.]|uniref:hypothetical protein n=1 Tax=Sphingomonas sp. TaxID=28214 RepID=UPI003CC6CDFD